MAMLVLGDFFGQFGIALCVMAAMIFLAAMIYVFLIQRHSIGAALGFVLAVIIGGLLIGSAIRFLM